MARSAFTTQTIRSITKRFGRFVALAAIVGLGVGFYAGLRMTTPDMKLSADRYFDDTQFMDARVVSTMGLTNDDLQAISDLDSIDLVMGAYETDVLATLNGKQHTIRIHSLPESSISGDGVYLNEVTLVEGRLPEKAGECVISEDVVLETPPSIGDVLNVDSGVGDLDDILSTRKFTVVGKVHASYYAESAALGTSTLGSGVVQDFIYVTESSFSEDYPITEAFVTVTGAGSLVNQSDAYKKLVSSALDDLNGIASSREEARFNQIKADAQAEVDKARAEYESERADALTKIDDARAELDDASSQLASSEAKLYDAQSKYDSGTSELAAQRASADKAIADAENEINENESELDAAQSQLVEGENAYKDGYSKWEAASSALDEQQAAIDALPVVPPGAQEQIDAARAQLNEQKAVLDAKRAELDAAQTQIASGREAIQSARAQLEEQKAQAESQLSAAQSQLNSAASEISSGWSQLFEGRQEYEEGLAELESNEAEAWEKFADAERELNDAQSKVDSIEHPDWLVMDRTKNVGAVSFISDADRIDHIARVFPLIFFLVAALVALTTMTRMVDEERVLIGTFKALGYSKARIASKYLIYALLASLAGSIVGILALGKSLPAIIMIAYAIIYYVPPSLIAFDPGIVCLSAGLGIGITVFATAFAVIAQLREKPASLMLPRAPKAGKRIVLERIKPLWAHMSFSWKVTMRNIFRNKSRFCMTLAGIAGCTALLLTGLGLHDSINDIIDVQYGELVHYNAQVTREEDATDEEIDAILDVLNDENLVEKRTSAFSDTLIAVDGEGKNHRLGLVVPSDPDAFTDLWAMRSRVGHEPVALDDDGVLIDEKLATTLGIGVGDNVVLYEQDAMGNATNVTYELEVTGIVENYIYDYAFVGRNVFERTFDREPEFATWYVRTYTDDATRSEFNDLLVEKPGVRTIAYNDETIKSYRSMLKSVDLIVVVLVVAAALLAYIVLYNLTSINIEERVREIATLKVLGFTKRETAAYIFREILITVVIGCLIGLILGVFLEGFVVLSAEVDQVMFGRTIHPLSFVYALALTLVFAVVILFTMTGRLSRIDMVESLKSTE